MLHAFFSVLPVLTDYQTWTEIAHESFTLGIVNAGLLGSVGGLRVVRRWILG